MRKFVTARSADDLIAKTEQRAHLVDAWTGHLHRRWHEGERNATALFREIRQLGYPGGELAVQRYLHRSATAAATRRARPETTIGAPGHRLDHDPPRRPRQARRRQATRHP